MSKKSRGRIRKKLSSSEDEDFTSPPNPKKTKHEKESDDDSTSLHKRTKTSHATESSNDVAFGASRSNTDSSQAISISSAPSIHNQSERCGKIISMRLQNFMCHANLFIEFGPNINFLVGNNGSGKSAVLTALILGLASSARVTNRANSIQKLIKNGETSAVIEVTLSNSGARPHKADIYGPRITIVRQIRQSSSQYHVKDARGNIISRKLDDIRSILLSFSIRVENPIFVLNQDAARQFLKDLEPKSNYSLLMKATQLDVCTRSLNSCHDHRMSFNYDVSLLGEKISQMKESCREEETKLKLIQSKDLVKIQLEEANTELAWLKVKQIKDELAELEKKKNSIESRKVELTELTHEKDNTQQTLSQQLSELNANKANCTETLKHQEEKWKNASRRVQELSGNISDIKCSISNVDCRLKEKEHALIGCQEQLENYNIKILENERLKNEHSSLRAELDRKVERNNEIINRLREEQKEIQFHLQKTAQQADTFKMELNEAANAKQNFKCQMDSLQRNKSDKISVYGEQAVQVMHMLRTQYAGPNMHKMPRGPIGKYITVPNPNYRDLVENILAQRLRAYIVGSDAERQCLRNILEKVYPGGSAPTIITTSYTDRVYNVSKYKVQAPPRTTLLMDQIKCEDPVVMNYLIDVFKVETVLITNCKIQAEYLTSEAENVPPHLTRVMVPQHGLEYIPAPNYSMYTNKIPRARFIQINVDERVKQVQLEMEEVRKREATTQINYEASRKQLNNYTTENNKKSSIINEHNVENKSIFNRILELNNYDYKEMPAPDVLQKHLDISKQKMLKYKEERECLVKQLEENKKKKAEVEQDQFNERDAISPIREQLAAIDSETSKVESKIRHLDHHLEGNTRKLNKITALYQTFMEQKAKLEQDSQKALEKAEKVGDFIETNKTEEKLLDQIGHYKAKVVQYETLNINKEQVEKKLFSLRKDLQLQNQHMALIKSAMSKLRMAYHMRSQCFQRTRFHNFTMVEYNFQQALQVRNFNANMYVDHQMSTLEIDVMPPSGNKTANSKTLSGGERSFTTVSLLKGLWTTSDHPFYFLDEYDVFTDEVNRSYITNTLIQEGIDYLNRQYCFLTPQDTKVDANQYITVHKLEAPERG